MRYSGYFIGALVGFLGAYMYLKSRSGISGLGFAPAPGLFNPPKQNLGTTPNYGRSYMQNQRNLAMFQSLMMRRR